MCKAIIHDIADLGGSGDEVIADHEEFMVASDVISIKPPTEEEEIEVLAQYLRDRS